MADLNKKALAEKLVEAGYVGTKKAATEIVDALFEEMTNTLSEGNTVDIYGFGKFEVVTRNARTGVNPATGAKIEIAESKAIKFKVAKSLKEAVK